MEKFKTLVDLKLRYRIRINKRAQTMSKNKIFKILIIQITIIIFKLIHLKKVAYFHQEIRVTSELLQLLQHYINNHPNKRLGNKQFQILMVHHNIINPINIANTKVTYPNLKAFSDFSNRFLLQSKMRRYISKNYTCLTRKFSLILSGVFLCCTKRQQKM